MKHLIIALLLIWGLFEIVGMISRPKSEFHGRALARLIESPAHRFTEPYRNAYFYLLGFSCGTSFDPAKVGYDIWLENDETFAQQTFDYDKTGRSDLRIPLSLHQMVPSWDAEDPLTQFRNGASILRTGVDRHHVLMTRYDHLLGMPFEDWGFGRHATPHYQDLLVIHRLYIADGWSRSIKLGLERLSHELVFWRTVLREAGPLATKVMAQIVIQDDIKLLSKMLSTPIVDKTIVAPALQLTTPLTLSEYSLQWPIEHQLTLFGHVEHSRIIREGEPADAIDHELEWLSEAAHLPSDAFKRIEHPTRRSVFNALNGEQTQEIYAAYYEALIKASNTGTNSLPKLHDIARTMRRGIVETLLGPTLIEPQWDVFYYHLMETDARLRLTSLQIQLRRPSAMIAIPTRLAQVGSQYFDPFTGLPMLWSPTQQKLYSVGKDRLDDGGDPSFDITVPAVIGSQRNVSNSLSSSSTIKKVSCL
ncbi:MAG TPA: hypothetical protein VIU63_07080 [Nitrospira sp.]